MAVARGGGWRTAVRRWRWNGRTGPARRGDRRWHSWRGAGAALAAQQPPWGPVGSYDSAGAATILPAITLLGFPGQTQTLADLYYNQYRDYDPSTGRYIQADPIGLSGDANPYAYAGGNPVRFTDAMGLQIADITTHPAFQTAGRLAARTPPGRIGWVIGTVARAIYDSCSSDDDEDNDRPCRTISGRLVPVGTIAYRPLDTPNRPQHGIVGPHYNLYRANKNPHNGICFWVAIGAVPAGALPPGAIPIEPFAN